MDGTTWGWQDVEGIALLTGLITALAGGFIGYGALRQRVETVREIATDARSLADRAKADLAAYKAEAERRFVTDETLDRVEERIVAAIERLGDRLDKLIDRGAQRT